MFKGWILMQGIVHNPQGQCSHSSREPLLCWPAHIPGRPLGSLSQALAWFIFDSISASDLFIASVSFREWEKKRRREWRKERQTWKEQYKMSVFYRLITLWTLLLLQITKWSVCALQKKKKKGGLCASRWPYIHLHTLKYCTLIHIGEGGHIIIASHISAPTHTFRGNFKLVWLTASACVSVALCCSEQSEPLACWDVQWLHRKQSILGCQTYDKDDKVWSTSTAIAS